jgi:type IV secretion system protein TrbL
VVLFLAWLSWSSCFFVLAVQLFITLIEFKLTTLAGFVLVPFALWNKTAFLAEKVLGNVVSSGIKVLVLAVIVGIGSGCSPSSKSGPPSPPSTTRWSSCWPRCPCWPGHLRAGHRDGPGVRCAAARRGRDGRCCHRRGRNRVAVGAAATGVGGAVAAGRAWPRRRQAGRQRCACAASDRQQRRSAFQAGSAAAAAASRALPLAWAMSPRPARRRRAEGGRWRALAEGTPQPLPSGNGAAGSGGPAGQGRRRRGRCITTHAQPAWAKRLHRRQQLTHAATTAAHTLRGGDGGSSSQGPSLRDSDS